MWSYNYPDELYHHGVLGMKWGHRTGTRHEENLSYRNSDKNSIAVSKTSEKKRVPVKEVNNNIIKTEMPAQKEAKSSVYSNKNLKLSDVKKKNIDTGIRVGTNMLAIYGAYKLAENAFGNL